MKKLPFRLGTSSYIIPDDILPNVRYLAGKVRDVELVLFEVDEDENNGQAVNNLPTPDVIDELKRLAKLYDLTYTVHLPLDLKLADDGSAQDKSLIKARRVIESIGDLDPHAYVLHLDGKDVRHSTDPEVLRHWQDQAVCALEIVADWAGGFEKLAVENLEGYPPYFNLPVLERVPVSRCVDIGHLWLDGVPVLPYLEQALPRTRVIHIHGIGERDHQSLSLIPERELAAVLKKLSEDYHGVVTVEIFSEEDFISSMEAVQQSLTRLQKPNAPLTFILGGARSGKSAYAQQLARQNGGSVLYVATATAGDEEMKTRIAAHRAERPANWRTLEAPLQVGKAISQALDEQPADVVLMDCLTMLANNVLMNLPENSSEKELTRALLAEIDALLVCRQNSNAHWIIVSNEVGLGLVPSYPMGRFYRDALGRANQRLAEAATEALLLVAGKPLSLK